LTDLAESKEVIPADCIPEPRTHVSLIQPENPPKGEVEMANRKTWIILSITIIMAMIIMSCATATPAPVSAPEVQVVRETVVSVETVVETIIQTVEVPVEVPAEPTSPKPEGTLRVAVATFPNTLDGPLAAEQNARNASRPLYDSLLFVNDNGDIEPSLAERYEISDDGLEYIFYLREGVTFHNGEPFNADAVVYTWKRYSNQDLAWNERWRMADNLEKVDDMTVKITTKEPKPLLLRTIATHWAMVPPKYVEEVGDVEFGNNPVGTGPYMFVDQAAGDHITYKANPNYWREGYPKIENIIIRPIPESATRVAAIQTGEVDIVGRLSSEEAQSLLGAPGVQVIRYPVTRVYYIAFNNLTSGVGQPTEDPLVRQAMNYAVDVDAINDALFNGYFKPATGFVATGELGYGAVEPFGYDPDKALELLAQAGYPNGFKIGFACPAGAYAHFEEVCEVVQAYLLDVGIETDLEIMESGHYWALEAAKELPPLFGDSWSETTGEAYNRMSGALFGWDASYSSWEDEKIISMLHQIGTTVDIEARKGLYEELQVYMKENPPFIYLYEPMAFEAIRDHVQNYKPRGAEEYHLWATWVTR
jgi:peptide/nickel transport system substrate-binding protein